MIKFDCSKDKLISAISITSRAVATKSNITALEGIHINAGTVLSLTGYNMETGITVTIEADVSEMGTAVLPAKLFEGIIRKMPDDKISVAIDDNYRVHITSGISTYDISAETADDYPSLPDVEYDKAIYVPQNILKDMISGTVFSVAENSVRPIQTGCKFEIAADSITLVAVDGYRLAMRTEALDNPEERTLSFVVPGVALRELEKILEDCDDNASFTLGTKHIMFQIGNCTLVCRMLEGEFLDWKRVLPTDNPIRVCANVKSLLSALDRVSLITSDKNKSPVRLTVGNNVMVLRSSNAIGHAYDECIIAGDGKDLEIGFNCKYMMEAVKAVTTEEFMLELKTSLSPAVLRPVEGNKFTYMVLPVRMKAE